MTYNNGHFILKHKNQKNISYVLFVNKILRTHVNYVPLKQVLEYTLAKQILILKEYQSYETEKSSSLLCKL